MDEELSQITQLLDSFRSRINSRITINEIFMYAEVGYNILKNTIDKDTTQSLIQDTINNRIELFESNIKNYTEIHNKFSESKISETISNKIAISSNDIIERIICHIDAAKNGDDINDKSSVIKGRKGEDLIREMIQDTYLVNKYIKESGDFMIKQRFPSDDFSNISVMIEVKNYAGIVPTREVNKFYRDLGESPAVGAGLFLSLTSPIQGIIEPLKFKMVRIDDNRNIPCIFLYTSNEYMVRQTIELLFTYAKRKIDINVIKGKIQSVSLNLSRINKIDSMIVNIRETLDNLLDKLRHQTLLFKYDMETIMSEISDTMDCTGHNLESTKDTFFISLENIMDFSVFRGDKNRMLFYSSIEPILHEEFIINIIDKNKICIKSIIIFNLCITKTKVQVDFDVDIFISNVMNSQKYLANLEVKNKRVILTYKFSIKKHEQSLQLLQFNGNIIKEIAESLECTRLLNIDIY